MDLSNPIDLTTVIILGVFVVWLLFCEFGGINWLYIQYKKHKFGHILKSPHSKYFWYNLKDVSKTDNLNWFILMRGFRGTEYYISKDLWAVQEMAEEISGIPCAELEDNEGYIG